MCAGNNVCLAFVADGVRLWLVGMCIAGCGISRGGKIDVSNFTPPEMSFVGLGCVWVFHTDSPILVWWRWAY